ncbi:MAG: 3-deoxy-D-manno-octulosonic acid transferase [Bacteroidales bacterium]|nr:3-deoxy-D-manno-octulosonic acid transferase [Bacteroidales bacterium]MCF8390537.1 3-deoxy-D-manno-octulosonic acid transferase [Bacteroidales bacterium]
MRIVYKIAIQIYFFLVLIASLFNAKALRWLSGRRHLWKRLKEGVDKSKELYWFHCSSLGEFEQGRPLIEEFRKRKPGAFILLTFFSPSGFDLRKNYQGADLVSYLPLDTGLNAWRFINLVKPKAVYFIKYEFWYYFLRTLFKKKIPVYLVSAKFRKDQTFFKWYGAWYLKFLRFFQHFFVQDESSAALLRKAGYINVSVTGDTRFDRVHQLSQLVRDYPGIELFRQNKKTLVAGSIWEKDEEILIKYINSCTSDYKFILAPHEINSRKMYKLVSEINGMVVRFTDEDKSSFPNAKVLLIDTIGHLSTVYKYGDLAYIGGGFGKGIHNILEPATYGLPVLFGPNYEKFTEAVQLIQLEAAFNISDFAGLEERLNQLLENDELRKNCSQTISGYIKSSLGATSKILDLTT